MTTESITTPAAVDPPAAPARKKPAAKKHPALVLDHPGAPSTGHVIPGVPGVYYADRPTPVGGIGEATLAQANDCHASEGCPLKLVQITDNQLAALRKAAEQDRRAERGLTTEE